jgi:hypothetical protein
LQYFICWSPAVSHYTAFRLRALCYRQ